MLGTRGVRLGILQPDLYEMQVRALFRAAKQVPDANVEVMVPLVDYERELEFIRERIVRIAKEEGVSYPIGSMIELPRACFVADRIAEQAEFFSFGTNDLTQTGLGFSREDIEARILERYIDVGILDRSPFETIDEPGVGQLVRMAAWLGRKARPKLKIGICGEHGGDPESIAFFAASGIDYVSCSPPRVPAARLAAAQAAIRESS
jgi:pyruvate, orthophosphate dikinase